MAVVNATFQTNDLQTTNRISNAVMHESAPRRKLKTQKLARANKQVITGDSYDEKTITLEGTLVGSSQSDFDDQVDSLKDDLEAREGTLDIDFGGSTRRYTATCERVEIEDRKIDVASYRIDFLCVDPYGTSTTPVNHSDDGNTSSPVTGSEVNDGNGIAEPVWTLTFNDTEAVDQDNTSSNTTTFIGDQGGTDADVAQSFTPTQTRLSGVTVEKGTTVGTPVGNLVVTIEGDSSGEPDGVALATKTYTQAEWDALSDGAVFIPLPCTLPTVGTTQYWVVFTDATNESSNNYYVIGNNNTDTYAGGNRAYDIGAGWVDAATDDLYFSTHYYSVTEVEVENTTTQQALTVTEIIATDDVLAIDVENKSVTLNGVEVDYGGQFMQLNPGTNNYSIAITGSNFDVDLDIDYNKRQL